MNIKIVLIRSDGDVNGFFTLTSDVNKVRKYWSCDSGSLEQDDDGEYDLSDEQHNRLFDLWSGMSISPQPENELEEWKCDYALFDYETGKCLKKWVAAN